MSFTSLSRTSLGDVPNLCVTLQIGVVRYPDVGLLYMIYHISPDVNQHVNYLKKTERNTMLLMGTNPKDDIIKNILLNT